MILGDTIAAVSSPPGAAARGIIRVSGPRALAIAGQHFRPTPSGRLADCSDHRRLDGRLQLPSDIELPGVAFVFRSPRSFTTEDVVELHVPGSPGLLALIMDALLAAGARAAEPGEFTARAFRSGVIDLSQAEGIAEMIHARSDAQLRAARRLLDGVLARDAAAARETLTELRALVEAALDFADEDIEFISPDELIHRLRTLADALRATARADARVEHLAEPPRIVLVGPPNAGKSTLLNRLTGLDRAICSPIAGTTRDVLAAPVRLPHGEAMLCDTAGLRSSGGTIDDQAYRAARAALSSAALVVWVTDVNAPEPPPADTDFSAAQIVAVINKIDAATDEQLKSTLTRLALDSRPYPKAPLPISARTGEGCDRLIATLDDRLHLSEMPTSDDILLSADLRAAVGAAVASVDRAVEFARGSARPLENAELVAAELSDASRCLGRLAGETDVDELYDRIFSRFCIGK